MKKNPNKGFTLLELLIVIAIIAIIAAFLIWILNPAETLRKGRDSQRMSDLKTLNQALAFYITVISNPVLDGRPGGNPSDNWCEDSENPSPPPSGWGKMWSSAPFDFASPHTQLDCVALSHPDPKGTWYPSFDDCIITFPTDGYNVNGTGWLPVNFTQIIGGSPIARLPVDPVNKYIDDDFVGYYYYPPAYYDNPGYFYLYTCKETTTPGWKCGSSTWELNANLESEEFREERLATDGGDDDYIYELGTCLFLLPISLSPP